MGDSAIQEPFALLPASFSAEICPRSAARMRSTRRMPAARRAAFVASALCAKNGRPSPSPRQRISLLHRRLNEVRASILQTTSAADRRRARVKVTGNDVLADLMVEDVLR